LQAAGVTLKRATHLRQAQADAGRQAAELYSAGPTIDQVAGKLGISRAKAAQLIGAGIHLLLDQPPAATP
jgi:hypothetical protein